MQAISIAASGMMAAADRLHASAQRVAASDAQAERAQTLGDVDYVNERVQQIGAATDFKANAAVIRTADEMAGALLNLKV
ncbi:flagellar basal body rod C-terminal domain-containing protein [Caulobacter sp.]|uniref:flagellar basal body rod C-terminal domain-containing protein n=1 Tax=Caulobacter sp. TaxID=78 RepID=UPI001B28848E|nr:flagellar basal body rod C-terminal domain-containing protein [Caulobacter sp.]MBO9545745.1 flagellar hook protein FlgE [Caulobacter sp.]